MDTVNRDLRTEGAITQEQKMKTIRRRIARIPYARNGNVGMNKPEYQWDVYDANGVRIMLNCTTLREAKTYAGERGTYMVVR